MAGSFNGGLVAGTAWLFAREEMAGSVDFLFIDEAGQVSLANVTAIAPATRNLVLIGDQMQLAQPSQGTHPDGSGESCLNHLLAGHVVVPSELGVFLDFSRRMHPAICSFISECFYAGELSHYPSTEKQSIEMPPNPGPVAESSGIFFHPVSHIGNTQSSEEEAAAIRQITDALLGRTLTASDGQQRPLTIDDILFVAPYNMQVRLLSRKLPGGAHVGSVDKFQGQEAPVVIVSMCCSAGEFGPRGLGFILDRNRMNVAISRARALSIVVGDPAITSTTACSIDEIRMLATYCRIVSPIYR